MRRAPSVSTRVASSVNHIIARIAERAGDLEGPTNPHAFRHAFARQYLMNGEIGMLSDIMGHADIAVTKRFYSNFSMGLDESLG